ncbi:Guanine nucleotide-binding protein G(k) subunit alpha [Aphelenchoides bicaudatus]|nr:Guanine nucleotide-binding protein G(k) subunit alpha [Aphelenchoides bicaudatus]
MGNCLDCCIPEDTTPKDRVVKEKDGELMRFFMTGLGSAGKTTIVRQLFLLCNSRSNYKVCNENWQEEITKPDDNELWVNTVRKNILDSMDIFIKQLRINGAQFDDKHDESFAKTIEEICEMGDEGVEDLEVTSEFTHSLLKLFQSQAIQNVWKKRNVINVEGKKLFDGSEHFMRVEKIEEAFGDNYVASDQDKVHSRKPTVDMQTYRFKINNTRIEINDVGGQRSRTGTVKIRLRSKLFKDMTLVKIVDYLRNWSFSASDTRSNFILLVVSTSDFNVKHDEFEGTLLDECVEYMKVLMNNPVAQNCGLFIFFNKKDRFKEKLQDPDCREDVKYLSAYLSPKQLAEFQQKGKFNEKEMQKALSDKFTEAINTLKARQRNTFCRFTCAVDSKMMEGLFSAIKDDQIQDKVLDILG